MANDTQPKRIPAITVQPLTVEGAETDIQGAARLLFRSASGKTLSAALGQIPATLHNALMFHGLKQKLIDAAAISRDPETGRSATVDDKWAAVEAVWQRLLNGEWNAQRGDGTGSGGLLFKALCRFYPAKTADDIRAWLEKRTDKEKAALRLNPKIAAIIEQVRAEQAKADDIDTDELLDELS